MSTAEKKDGQPVGDRIGKINMATVYEIIQGINQAAANAFDGAHDASLQADGIGRSAGLKREQGHYIHDRRLMDGFMVSFHGPILRVKYQAETRIKEVQDSGFENEIGRHLQEVVKFLKKEYKAITGNTLSLTKEGDHRILVQRMSNYRTDVQAQCDYRIGGMNSVDAVDPGDSKDRLDASIRDFLAQGKKAKKPSNVKI